MCAIFGAQIDNPHDYDWATFKNVVVESGIRGLHATGISWVKDGEVHTIKEPIPAKDFVEKYLTRMEDYVDGNSLRIIGHCRYSTSDLEYNQPLSKKGKSIVHNGVISQDSPDTWKSTYGIETETKNDSELVLHSEDPLNDYPDASMAVAELYSDSTFKFYRNGKRPLYLSQLENGCILTSTRDIPVRCQLVLTMPVPVDSYVTIDSEGTMEVMNVLQRDDLQRVNYEEV